MSTTSCYSTPLMVKSIVCRNHVPLSSLRCALTGESWRVEVTSAPCSIARTDWSFEPREAESFLRETVPQLKKFPPLLEPEGLLLCSQLLDWDSSVDAVESVWSRQPASSYSGSAKDLRGRLSANGRNWRLLRLFLWCRGPAFLYTRPVQVLGGRV